MIENCENYFFKLQKWYSDQCNGSWEKKFGIKIDTIDNPGWSFLINLSDTTLINEKFEKIKIDISENNWVHCWTKDMQFQGGGGPCNLVDIIKFFISWSEKKILQVPSHSSDSTLYWLQKWYQFQCDGDWEHQFGIKIESLVNPGWSILIDIQETKIQDLDFHKICIYRTHDDWLVCEVKKGVFDCQCGVYNLTEVLQIFRKWVETRTTF